MNTDKKILVIEDEPQIRNNLAEILTLHQFDTLIAANGTAGIAVAQTETPDLILCDVAMPELDGYGVLTALRQNEATASIPLIFLTAHSDRPSTRKGMELGADDYLNKPCTTDELLKAIQTQLAKRLNVHQEIQKRLTQLRQSINLALPHEIYTPLNGILGMSDLLIQEHRFLSEDEELEIAQAIHQSARRLYHLGRNFLLYSELELIASNPEKVKALQSSGEISYIRKIISDVAYQRADTDERLGDLILEVDNAPLAISDLKLKKVVEELIDNAFKFSQPRTPVYVRGRKQSDHYLLHVLDRGRGMTAEQIANIGAYAQFERKTYEQQGTGLGLSIAKRMIELHRGELTIDSMPRMMTKINVKLPIAPDNFDL